MFRSMLAFVLIVRATAVAAAPISLLADLNDSPVISQFPTGFVPVGAETFFFAANQLWATDGTPASRRAIALTGGAVPTLGARVVSNGKLYFLASSQATGTELWVSDGTGAGTHLVKDLCAGACSPSIEALTALNGDVYFVGPGVTAGRKAVFRVAPADDDCTLLNEGFETTQIGGMVAFGGRLVLASDAVGYSGTEKQLWAIDPVSPGAPVNLCTANTSCDPNNLFVAAASVLLFSGKDGNGVELWRATSVAAGNAVLYQDIAAGAPSSLTADPRFVVTANGTVFFTTGGSSPHLYRLSNPAGAGPAVDRTATLTKIRPPRAVVGDRLFFAAEGGVVGVELYTIDTVALSPSFVKELRPGVSDAFDLDTSIVAGPVPGTAIFSATDGVGDGLYSSDGTAGGTVLLKKPFHVSSGSVTRAGARVYMTATGPDAGGWISDGTANGTVSLGTFAYQDEGSDPRLFASGAGFAWFSARAADGLERFYSVRLRDRVLKPIGEYFEPLTAFVNDFYVSLRALPVRMVGIARDRRDARMKLIGGDGDRVVVLAGVGGTIGATEASYVELGGNGLAYSRATIAGEQKLIETDGTPQGTRVVAAAGTVDRVIGSDNGRLFFSRRTAGGSELYAYDLGAGTVALLGSSTFKYPAGAGIVAGRAFICLGDDPNTPSTFEYLVSDGVSTQVSATCQTPTGARFGPNALARTEGGNLVVDLGAGPFVLVAAADSPKVLGALPGQLFFLRTVAGVGSELWASDGSPANTRMVAEIVAGAGSPVLTSFLALEDVGRVLFTAGDDAADRELWTSDGTPLGTFRLANLNATASSFPTGTTRAGRFVLFSAAVEGGREPYALDVYEQFGPHADLSLQWLASEVRVGEGFALTARVHNDGPDTAPEAWLEIELPQNATLLAVPAGCAVTGVTLVCVLASLAPGADADVALSLRADAVAIVTMRGSLYAPQSHDPAGANDVATTKLTVRGTVDLRLSSDDDLRGAVAGDTVTLAVTVENRGATAATLVRLSVTLAPNTELPATYSGPCAALGPTALRCPLADLDADERRGFVLPLRTTSTDPATLSFSVDSAEPDVDPSNNALSTQLEVAGRDVKRVGELSPPPPATRAGCACRSGDNGNTWMLVLLLLTLKRRRPRCPLDAPHPEK
ncbi:MAG: hypothetical protein IT381_23290 [Deltaproteobacteria bacterium]|nr:hypothetical protein [Deltaproteobacteria bacterium]